MLEQMYQEGLRKSLITETFPEWRINVINRINVVFNKDYTDLTDEEIVAYLDNEVHEEYVDSLSLRIVK